MGAGPRRAAGVGQPRDVEATGEASVVALVDRAEQVETDRKPGNFEPGENLYLDGDRWDARARPLSIDIQPFLIGRAAPGATDKQVHIDLASPRIAPDEASASRALETSVARPVRSACQI